MWFYLDLIAYSSLIYNLYTAVKRSPDLSDINYLDDRIRFHREALDYYERIKTS